MSGFVSWCSVVVSALAVLGWGMPAQAVCLNATTACQIEGGEYHMLPPHDGFDGPAKLLVFLHGYGSHGGNSIANARLTEPARARGYAIVAPTGSPRQNAPGARWLFHPDFPPGRDEFRFLLDVVADAARRLEIDRDHVVLSGFSGGGFMTSYMACRHPEAFLAFAPLAGGFWRPHPDQCAGPVHLLQTHGWADGVVPLEGRALGGGRYRQGDIFTTLEIWRQTNGCTQMRPDQQDSNPRFWSRHWSQCAEGGGVSFILHDGAHTMPSWWPDLMLDWVAGLPDQ